jgi:uncharacterized protein (DUF2252 family)
MRDPISAFKDYNRPLARRNPELLRYKVARMAKSPFAFYRGTFHLFARDLVEGLPVPCPLGSGPELDLVGDIHSENYGTFQAEDGEVHYDANDFDETTTGRFGLDVCRLATSHVLAAQERTGEPLESAVKLTLVGLRAYVEAVRRLLKKGKDLHLDVSESHSSGASAVDDLVSAMAAVKRPAFINNITEWDGRRRQLIRTADYFNLPAHESEQAVRLLADYRQRFQKEEPRDGFFNVEDVCGRVSGIGSMGRLRYVVLLAGKGSADARNVLLEFKEALPSAYDVDRGHATSADALLRRAERVVTVQKQSQAAVDPYAGWAVDGGQSFQARQRGPHDERLRFAKLSENALEGAVKVQASILARVHARAAMRALGPSNPLAELEDAEVFCQRVLAFALGYAGLVRQDWQRFVGVRAELDQVENWVGTADKS